MGKEGGIVLTIPWPMAFNVTRIPWEAGAYETAHQSSNQLLVKHYWFQVLLCNKTVISCLFGRMVETMPIGTVDSSMHNCP